ncbi:MAG: DUF1738 domain-containing protein [Deltaproteobacteria bacterium]|nr:DUF1738 domain-containing protein [Deltaproteobacteria bacterium]
MSEVKSSNLRNYELVTQRVIEALEKNVVPWKQPWRSGGLGFPSNLLTKRPYRGINAFLLASSGYRSPYWLTFNQAKAKGGTVRKGEHGTAIVFWKIFETPTTPDAKPEKRPFLKRSTVFNVEQCDGIECQAPAENHENDPIDECEKILSGYRSPPRIAEGGDAALYSLNEDLVRMPRREQFLSAEEWYNTLWHELAHSTAHPTRLNRKLVSLHSSFFSKAYDREELIAEMAASFLCATAGIDCTFDNSVSYIQGWLSAFREKPRMLIEAASAAQKAADYILNASRTEGTSADEYDTFTKGKVGEEEV